MGPGWIVALLQSLGQTFNKLELSCHHLSPTHHTLVKVSIEGPITGQDVKLLTQQTDLSGFIMKQDVTDGLQSLNNHFLIRVL